MPTQEDQGAPPLAWQQPLPLSLQSEEALNAGRREGVGWGGVGGGQEQSGLLSHNEQSI